jgi:NADP-dependent 3-hydroxy acid dehydrogenase YdfG
VIEWTWATALVTGASSGIGRAIAIAIGGRGARVALVGRNREALDGVGMSIRAAGGQAQTFALDLTDDPSVSELAAQIRQTWGALDMLVHSAGVYEAATHEAMPVHRLDQLYRVNVRAPYLLTQLLLPELRARQGQIVFINSTVGLQTRGGISQYSATKYALRALADGLRDELRPDGVRVLSVYPGRTASPMQQAVMAGEGRTYDAARLAQPDDVAQTVLGALELPRTAAVSDVTIRENFSL